VGISSDAILFYGLMVAESGDAGDDPGWISQPEHEDHEDGFPGGVEEAIAAKAGVVAPEAEYGPSVAAEYSAYWEASREAMEASGIVVGQHCSWDFPLPYLAVTSTHEVAGRGYAIDVSDKRGEFDEEAADKLLAGACEAMGVKPAKGRWWLCSLMG